MYVETIPGYYANGSDFQYYNVSQAVGRWLICSQEDVTLVQWFLDEIYRLHWQYNGPGGPADVYGPMVIDGVCGKQTEGWITDFQYDSFVSGGIPMWGDGRVDRAAPGSTHSWRGTRYTIVVLNEKMRDIHPGLFGSQGTLTIPASCPPMLAAIIAQIGPFGP
ncbi:MAG TPA: hypothetical protein DCE18_20700 [Syntrophobacteraceae bacterium]|nr:hypothetical protein [Syntrophobacteraceae bacterium]